MSRFRTYLENTFHLTPTESEEVMSALVKPLKKSIRINTHKISREDFILHAHEQEWTLTETDIPEVFLIDREDTTVALGRTLEHQAGWFYIQEVAAAHPPFLLKREIIQKTKYKIQNEGSISRHSSQGRMQGGREVESIPVSDTHDNLDSTSRSQALLAGMTKSIPLGGQDDGLQGGTILDMCASPGGKTTQLADYFPESLIIANEVNRSRTPQLFDNLDRMGYDNVAVVSCDGRFFQNFPEYFDAVLLDAPCSGEGTAFRDSSVIDHWHEKNIHRIAKLQKQLFETALTIVKPGGFISYSTCTLNKEENEEVIGMNNDEGIMNNEGSDKNVPEVKGGRGDFLSEKWNVQCLFLKRFWPHIEHTGGFFASIFRKQSAETTPHEYPLLPSQGQTPFVRPATKGERETVERFVVKHLKSKLKNTHLFISKDGVYANSHNLGPLMQYFFFVHAGAKIGTLKGNVFTPTQHLWWHLEETVQIPVISLDDKDQSITVHEEGFYTLTRGRGIIGIGQVLKGKILTNM